MASSISLPSFAAKTSNILNPDGTSIDQSFAPVNGGMFRNRIINGDMRIDQRSNGGVVNNITSSQYYSIDRLRLTSSQNAKYSVQRSTVAPPGFTHSALFTSLSEYSVLSSDSFTAGQVIEGFNVSDFDLGLSTAKTFILSFWVRCSLTGIIGGAIVNVDGTRSYPFPFTVNAANTWEYKTITIAGDTTGTWNKAEGAGLRVRFNLGSGTSQSATAGAWTAGDFGAPTGAISLVGTNEATMYITGLQVEKGSSATPFEFRLRGAELPLCQRYFQKTYNIDTNPGTATGVGAIQVNAQGNCNYLCLQWSFPVSMRATPSTITIYNPTTGGTGTFRSDAANVAANVAASGQSGVSIQASNVATGVNSFNTVHATAEAEL